MPLVTLDEAKTHLNITSTTHDAELSLYVEAAADAVAEFVGDDLSSQTFTNQIVRSGAGIIVLEHTPVTSVEAIGTYSAGYLGDPYTGGYDTGYGGDYTGTNPIINGDAGIIRSPYTSGQLVWVTYTAGRAVVPAAIRLATLVVIGRLWETQRGNTPSALPATDFGDPSLSTGGLPLLPPRAQALLEPYRRSASIA